MKFLVSTLNLKNALLKAAIENQATDVTIDGKARRMTFSDGTEIGIEPLAHYYNAIHRTKISEVKLKKIADFLELLQEQPIVAELPDYKTDGKMHDEIEIRFSQFEWRA